MIKVKNILLIFISTMMVFIFFYSCETKKEVERTSEKVLQLPDKAKVLSDLVKLRNGIATYYMNNGRYPENLEELNISTDNPLEDFVYNKNNGNVKNKDYPQF